MFRNDPFIVMPAAAAIRIANSAISHGELVLGHFPDDALYVVKSVEASRGVKVQVDIPRQFAALLSARDRHCAGQWMRSPSDQLDVHHFFQFRRPGTTLTLETFRKLAPQVQDPGEGMGLLITHAPDLSPELVAFGAQAFAGWLVTRAAVRPVHLAVEPETVGIAQLAGKWPVEELAAASVMVVGCGSIGSAAAEALAGYGVGRLELVDPDRFLWHNVVRHTLGSESVGRFKVDAIKTRQGDRWPSQEVIPHVLDVVTEAHYVRPLVDRVDLVLCAADGIAPRRVVSHLARRARKPSCACMCPRARSYW